MKVTSKITSWTWEGAYAKKKKIVVVGNKL